MAEVTPWTRACTRASPALSFLTRCVPRVWTTLSISLSPASGPAWARANLLGSHFQRKVSFFFPPARLAPPPAPWPGCVPAGCWWTVLASRSGQWLFTVPRVLNRWAWAVPTGGFGLDLGCLGGSAGTLAKAVLGCWAPEASGGPPEDCRAHSEACRHGLVPSQAALGGHATL